VSARVLGGAGLIVLTVGLGVYGANQVLRVRQMRGEIEAMERDIVTLRARADELSRTVERLRAQVTQLSTFMYYGNLFVGKLLEAKHLGCSTITDVGTTYKLCRRAARDLSADGASRLSVVAPATDLKTEPSNDPPLLRGSDKSH